MRPTITLAALFALAACATVHRVTADEVRATFVGMSGYCTSANGKPFVAYLSPNGTAKLRREGEGASGRYHIEPDGEVCVEYQGYQQGQEVCQSMWKDTDRYHSTLSTGQPGVTITAIKPGNAENL